VQIQNEGVQQLAHKLALSHDVSRIALLDEQILFHDLQRKYDLRVLVTRGHNFTPRAVSQGAQQLKIINLERGAIQASDLVNFF
jgi:hypothetical protein